MKIAISAESTLDLTKELIEKYDIKILPFSILLGDQSAYDGEITTDQIIEFVNKSGVLPKTSAVNEYQYEEHFKKILKKNDAIIHFSLSSEMSSAYFNACKVADNMNNVYVVDTRSLSTGIALQAIYASKLVKEGLEPNEIVEKVKERIPYTQASFVLSRLDYLYKGGRCNAMQLLGSNLLKIHPQIIVSEGKMDAHKKFRGNMSNVVFKYVEATLEEFNNPDLEEVFITYTTANLDVISEIKNILVARGFKNIHITTAGATISSHCGEHCLGILYMNDGDRK